MLGHPYKFQNKLQRKCLGRSMSIPVGIGVGQLDDKVNVLLILSILHTFFPKYLFQFTFLPKLNKGVSFSKALKAFIFRCFIGFSHSNQGEMKSKCCSIVSVPNFKNSHVLNYFSCFFLCVCCLNYQMDFRCYNYGHFVYSSYFICKK